MTSRHTPRSVARFFLTVALFAGAAGSLAACNTLAGAGQDVSSVGHDVTKGANYSQGKVQQAVPQAASH